MKLDRGRIQETTYELFAIINMGGGVIVILILIVWVVFV
jgi:hypothetical protein